MALFTVPSLAQTPQVSPVIVKPSVRMPEKRVDIIRIGRLELTRKNEYEQQADGTCPQPFNPLQMVRSQLGLGSQPAITIAFDLRWREPSVRSNVQAGLSESSRASRSKKSRDSAKDQENHPR